MNKPNNAKCSTSIFLVLLMIMNSLNSFSQTIQNIPAGAVLASMPTGITLIDGTVLKGEVISLGSAKTSYVEHGQYNQYQFGGIYNGVNDGALIPTGPDGIALSGYNGSKNPLNFTRLGANPRGDLDSGDVSNYAHAVGYYFWTDRPIVVKELLFIDCDGQSSGSGGNREWFSFFGYNDTTPVNPSISLEVATLLDIINPTVHSSWHTLVDTKIPAAIPGFTTKSIVRSATGTSGVDPDSTAGQVLYNFGTDKTDHIFILWGIRDIVASSAGIQNSGISPLVFNFNLDWGDAPNSYGTDSASGGPVHVVPSSPLLTLGASVSSESNGLGGILANSDSDNSISSVDSIFRRPAFPTDTIGSYSLTVNYTNNSGQTANYAAWIDWNNNGVFDSGEGKTTSSPAATTTGTVTFTWINVVMTNHILTDHTFARIRTTTEAISATDAKNAPFQDGEVEDVRIPFSDFGGGPLPLRLLSFQANPEQDKIQLQWTVADQVDVDRYEIYRSSNGIDFRKIGLAKAVKNQTRYSLWDNDPMNGINLYQLKSVDIDGRFQYAPNTLKVNFNKNTPKTTFYPNPSNTTISVNTSAYQNLLELKVFNITGQQIMQQVLNKGLNNIDISSLVKGTYYFKLMNGAEQVATEKIEITK